MDLIAHNQAPHDDWLAAYQEILRDPGGIAAVKCPNCGSHELQLVMVVSREHNPIGWGALWCDHCKNGIAIDRAQVKDWMRTIIGSDKELFNKTIPNYTVIPPS